MPSGVGDVTCVTTYPYDKLSPIYCIFFQLWVSDSPKARLFLCLCFCTCSTHCVPYFHFFIFLISFSTVSRHSTSKLTWSECMAFSDTQTYIVNDLGGLKRFFNQGLYLTIEEEKVKKIMLMWVWYIDIL